MVAIVVYYVLSEDCNHQEVVATVGRVRTTDCTERVYDQSVFSEFWNLKMHKFNPNEKLSLVYQETRCWIDGASGQPLRLSSFTLAGAAGKTIEANRFGHIKLFGGT